MSLVIRSGLFRGLSLQSPNGNTARPTLSRIREATLNALQSELGGAKALDLFAGSGAFGIEALSRGARSVIFVEKDRTVLKALRHNLNACRERVKSQNMHIDMQLVAQDLATSWQELKAHGPFDLIWADPPYALCLSWAEQIAERLPSLLATEGLWVVESARQDASALSALLSTQPGLKEERHRSYGDITISSFRYTSDSGHMP